ncbi:MAG: dihydroneopterin aldolase [Peptostreptococcaceae bacterium]|jgi:dihydroneopterin aldolase|nr:dihydroneopterin aldolase [Peptostreptococcaceae bacterium]
MDKIILKDMQFFGYHGVFKEEEKLGQIFIIDFCGLCDLKEAKESDNIDFGISYADIFDLVKDICENKRFNLIEALAECIAKEVLLKFGKISEVKILVKKPNAPINGHFNYAGVEVIKKR